MCLWICTSYSHTVFLQSCAHVANIQKYIRSQGFFLLLIIITVLNGIISSPYVLSIRSAVFTCINEERKKTAHESIISLQFANERICTWDLRRIEFDDDDDDDENGDDDEYNMSPYLNSCKKVSFKKFHWKWIMVDAFFVCSWFAAFEKILLRITHSQCKTWLI